MEKELPVMNVSEVAAALGITPGSVRRAVSDGKLAAIRKGGGTERAGFLLIEKLEVERYRREHLGRRGVGSASHPLHGVGRQKKGANTPGIQSHMPPDEPIAPDDPTPPGADKRRDDTR